MPIAPVHAVGARRVVDAEHDLCAVWRDHRRRGTVARRRQRGENHCRRGAVARPLPPHHQQRQRHRRGESCNDPWQPSPAADASRHSYGVRLVVKIRSCIADVAEAHDGRPSRDSANQGAHARRHHGGRVGRGPCQHGGERVPMTSSPSNAGGPSASRRARSRTPRCRRACRPAVPVACSGAMYAAVPSDHARCHCRRRHRRRARSALGATRGLAGSSALASPKSSTFTVPSGRT